MSTFFLPKAIDEYSERFTTPETPELAALNRETHLKRGDSVMLSGHLQGALLQTLSKMIRPACILEIGTFTGYSAICLAGGLLPGGTLHTIEIDEELRDMVQKYISEAHLQNSIVLHTGVAADVIPTIQQSFDLVFIDADKSNYSAYFDLVFPSVPVGGWILADNVLYDGEVLLPREQQTKNARAIADFNRKVSEDPRVERLLLPIRDGIMIMRKTAD